MFPLGLTTGKYLSVSSEAWGGSPMMALVLRACKRLKAQVCQGGGDEG